MLSRDISRDIAKLRSEFINLGYEDDFVVHTGPLIRKEEIYCDMLPSLINPICRMERWEIIPESFLQVLEGRNGYERNYKKAIHRTEVIL